MSVIAPHSEGRVEFRLSLLKEALLAHSRQMDEMLDCGLARTNAMECTDDHIYVFASYVDRLRRAASPTEAGEGKFEYYPRHRNAEYIARIAAQLSKQGFDEASNIVEALLPNASLNELPPADDLNEHRCVYFQTLLVFSNGIFAETAERLSSRCSELNLVIDPRIDETFKAATAANIVRLSHQEPKVLFQTVSRLLGKLGHQEASLSVSGMFFNIHYL